MRDRIVAGIILEQYANKYKHRAVFLHYFAVRLVLSLWSQLTWREKELHAPLRARWAACCFRTGLSVQFDNLKPRDIFASHLLTSESVTASDQEV